MGSGQVWEFDTLSTTLSPWKCSWRHLGRDRVTFWLEFGGILDHFFPCQIISCIPCLMLNNFAYLHNLPGLICRASQYTQVNNMVVFTMHLKLAFIFFLHKDHVRYFLTWYQRCCWLVNFILEDMKTGHGKGGCLLACKYEDGVF
jgi:hypothetical protein